MKFSVILWGLVQALRLAVRFYPKFAARVKERDVIAQFKLMDNSAGRWIKFKGGKIKSGAGIHENPDLSLWFQNKESHSVCLELYLMTSLRVLLLSLCHQHQILQYAMRHSLRE